MGRKNKNARGRHIVEWPDMIFESPIMESSFKPFLLGQFLLVGYAAIVSITTAVFASGALQVMP